MTCSSSIISGITAHIGGTLSAISALLQMLTAGVITLFVSFGLLSFNPQLAIGCTGFFGLTFWITGKIVRKELRLNASKIALATTQQIKLIQEGLGAIRDILLDGNQNIYVQSYQQCERPLRSLSARNQYLSSFPRYVLEALGMVVLSLLGWFLTDYYENPASVIPLLGLFALASQRLLPSLQSIYSGWSIMNHMLLPCNGF